MIGEKGMLYQNFTIVASKRNHLLPFNRWPFALTNIKKSFFHQNSESINQSINHIYLPLNHIKEIKKMYIYQ